MKKLIFKKIIKDISLFFFISITCVATIVWIIQAVNYLDLVSEDGHSLKVYFFYTIFSLPKILSNILPFMYMISLFYVIIQYEINNELIIYWINGITKLNFVNNIIKISILFFILQLFLTSTIVPFTLDKGRSFFRSSNVDLFTSIIKERKFIDTVENLTIFVEKKENNLLRNILIKEKIDKDQSQIIVAERGEIIGFENLQKNIILYKGKIIDTENNNQGIINFSKFNLDLSKFSTKTITHPKVQEMSSINLFKCLNTINQFKQNNKTYNKDKNFFLGCNLEISAAILEEFLKRFFSPLFIILIGTTSCLIIMTGKDEKSYKLKNFLNFSLGIALIIISEITLRFSGLDINNMIIYFLIPTSIFLMIYIYIFFNNDNLRRK